MRYTIWHNDSFINYMMEKTLSGHTVRLAATVECKNLDDVYEKTNNIDNNWTKNPEVLHVYTIRLRSLSIGDLIHDIKANKLYVVEDAGFREVTREEHASLDFIPY